MPASPATVDALAGRLNLPAGAHAAAVQHTADVVLSELERVTGRTALELEALPAGLEAVLLAGARLWTRRDSPAGVSAGFDGIPVYVSGTDPDLDALVIGLRAVWGIA